MKNFKKMLASLLSIAVIGTMISSASFIAIADTTNDTNSTSSTIGVSYASFIQNDGWQSTVSDGAEAGTTGKALRLQAFKANLTNTTTTDDDTPSITYQAYMQSYGWNTTIASDGEITGFTDKSKRMEAIRITISDLEGYSIEYRVYQQSYGWEDWVTTNDETDISNASIAGVTGKSKRIEALEIKIIASSDNTSSSDNANDNNSGSTTSTTNTTNMSNSDFENYLNTNFGSLTTDGRTIPFNWQVNPYSINGTDEVITTTLSTSSYLAWLYTIRDGYSSDLKSFLTNVNQIAKTNYPNKTIFCDVMYEEYGDYSSVGSFLYKDGKLTLKIQYVS